MRLTASAWAAVILSWMLAGTGPQTVTVCWTLGFFTNAVPPSLESRLNPEPPLARSHG